MVQPAGPPANQPLPTAQTNLLKIPTLPKNKKTLLFILSIALLILLIPLILLSTKQKPTPSPVETPKTWEIILNYNSPAQSLSLKKLSLLEKEIKQDFRSAQYSPYELVVSDKADRALFRTKINITQQFIYEIDEPLSSASAALVQPENLETIIYIPYQSSATKVVINENYSTVLQINVIPSLSFNLVPQVFAQTNSQSCGALQVVFISDGYTNFNQYHQQVTAIENKLKSTQPYTSVQPSIFDFKVIDNSQPLGCTQGLFSCANNSSRILQLGYGSYPSASKFIVLVNATNPGAIDNLGLTNDIGGNLAMLYTNVPNAPADLYTKVAAHEVLGHAVGQLYDRYVSLNPGYTPISGGIKSNCTDNPSGESWWRSAGSTGTYRGCANPSLYAPFPPTCRATQRLSSLGSPQTIMSADGCNSDVFDSVEQAWIRERVLPLYQNACPVTPTATPTATATTPTSTPRPTSTGPIPTLPPLPTLSSTLTNTTDHPVARFTYPGEGLSFSTYAGVTNRIQAAAQAPAGKTLTQLGIYRVPENTYATSSENWIPIETTSCNSPNCNLTANWIATDSDRQTWQGWYLTVKATDSSGITCNERIGGFHPRTPCLGGTLNVQVLPGSPREGFIFGAYGTGELFSPPQASSTPAPTSTTTTGNVYVCEGPTQGGSGKQVQITTLNCHPAN